MTFTSETSIIRTPDGGAIVDTPEKYANIRDILGPFMGRTIADITQHDKEDWDLRGECYVQILFTDASWIKFPISDDGFDWNDGDVEGVEPETE